MVRTLFACAEELAPAVVFVDEVDSLLSARGEEHDAMRRLKTEVLVQMDGVTTQSQKRVLVLAATNRPQDIDTACLRRFTKRVHIPLPDVAARAAHVRALCARDQQGVPFRLGEKQMRRIAERTERYSFSDLTALVREAAMQPLRELGTRALNVSADGIRAVQPGDFERALETVRPSANPKELLELEEWAREYGAAG